MQTTKTQPKRASAPETRNQFGPRGLVYPRASESQNVRLREIVLAHCSDEWVGDCNPIRKILLDAASVEPESTPKYQPPKEIDIFEGDGLDCNDSLRLLEAYQEAMQEVARLQSCIRMRDLELSDKVAEINKLYHRLEAAQ